VELPPLQQRPQSPTNEAIYLALRGLINALDRNTAQLERLMASFADVKAAEQPVPP
jgi:hypothetical protein